MLVRKTPTCFTDDDQDGDVLVSPARSPLNFALLESYIEASAKKRHELEQIEKKWLGKTDI